jgi:cobalt-zinc-cadmium efflux system outer membrane protein
MNKNIAIVILVLVCSVWSAQPNENVNLTDLIEVAKLYNPEIQAARAQYEAAQSRVSGFRSIMDPLFAIEFAGDMRMYSVSQQIPFPTKLTTLSHIAKTEAEVYEEEYRKIEQDVINKVKTNYSQLFFIYKKIKTVEQSIAFLNQLFHIASLHYAVNKVPQADILRAQVELAKAENELLTLKDEQSVIAAQLNALLNRNLDSILEMPEELNIELVPVKEDSLYDLAREHHPGLHAFRRQLKSVHIMLSLSKQSYVPDFMFKFTQQEMDHTFTDQKFMIGFTVPVWFWAKQNTMVHELEARVKMAEAHYQHMENMVLVAVKKAKTKFDRERRTAMLYESSILPQAEASYNAALVAYEANQIDFSGVLDTEKTLIQTELEYYRAQADLFAAFADLEEAVGIEF